MVFDINAIDFVALYDVLVLHMESEFIRCICFVYTPRLVCTYML